MQRNHTMKTIHPKWVIPAIVVAALSGMGAALTVGAVFGQDPAPVVMDEPAEAPAIVVEPIVEVTEPIPKMLVFTAHGTKTAIRIDLIRTITESVKGTFISWEGQDGGTIVEESFEDLLAKLD